MLVSCGFCEGEGRKTNMKSSPRSMPTIGSWDCMHSSEYVFTGSREGVVLPVHLTSLRRPSHAQAVVNLTMVILILSCWDREVSH